MPKPLSRLSKRRVNQLIGNKISDELKCIRNSISVNSEDSTRSEIGRVCNDVNIVVAEDRIGCHPEYSDPLNELHPNITCSNMQIINNEISEEEFFPPMGARVLNMPKAQGSDLVEDL